MPSRSSASPLLGFHFRVIKYTWCIMLVPCTLRPRLRMSSSSTFNLTTLFRQLGFFKFSFKGFKVHLAHLAGSMHLSMVGANVLLRDLQSHRGTPFLRLPLSSSSGSSFFLFFFSSLSTPLVYLSPG